MSIGSHFTLALVPVLITVGSPVVQARVVDFETRVEAQEAIERVYYSHQDGATRPFDEVLPRSLIEAKVRDYLKQSAALEQQWKTPVTSRMLRRELERISRDTVMPNRLDELFMALDYDVILIQECLARPVLVDRLTRNFFAYDRRIHAEARREAEELRQRLAEGKLQARAMDSRRVVVQFVRGKSFEPEPDTNRIRVGLSSTEFDDLRERTGSSVGQVGAVEETREAFVIRVILDESPDELTVASYVVQKRTWDEWWQGVSGDLNENLIETVAVAYRLPPVSAEQMPPTSGSLAFLAPCAPDDSWDNGALDHLPSPRYSHSTIWTGSLMLVWGGFNGSYELDTGGRYDPTTDSWSPISRLGAPAARSGHVGVWANGVLVIWGGSDGSQLLASGGRYDPTSDSWSETAESGAPTARILSSAVSTGNRVIVWGGYDGSYLTDGGIYDPQTDTWAAMTSSGAPAGRWDCSAIWTGSEMIIWGGRDPMVIFQSGGRYDPEGDSWEATSLVNAAEARESHSAVWTDTRMIVWGGNGDSGVTNTGGMYYPASDSWLPMTTTNAPEARHVHAAVWDGDEMIVWGGYPHGLPGGRYDPAQDVWATVSTENAPQDRTSPGAVWTDDLMIVWGGLSYAESPYKPLSSGGRYDPSHDSWTPTSMGGAPSPRAGHSGIWTGTEMIVWGGWDSYYVYFDTGGRYNPITDQWTATSLVDVPTRRGSHAAVWNGDEMLIWGGRFYDGGTVYLNTGGRYDPRADGWSATSTADAPTARRDATAVWTGSEMVVWGGYGSGYQDTGGRYNPSADAWVPTSTDEVPDARYAHSAVWANDDEMIVWGGRGSAGYLNTGGRYDPAADSWSAMSTTAAPAGRYGHATVWTEDEMIVWGGYSFDGVSNYFDDGGRYSPSSDTWSPTSLMSAPSGRVAPAAVWTGNVMVVWGGSGPSSGYLDTGGSYTPHTDSWSATTTLSAPDKRDSHTAVWTGSHMIVWGGYAGHYVNSGGRYALGHSIDDDGDGFDECGGDCNDAYSTIYPGAEEINDGLDNQCEADQGFGLIDEIAGVTGFFNAENKDEFSWPPQPGATSYEAARSSLRDLSGGCIKITTSGTSWIDGDVVPLETCFYYVVRALTPNTGSWGADSTGVERLHICP